jgi:predicted ATP-grasp superfamily ATP-dependent carboligase
MIVIFAYKKRFLTYISLLLSNAKFKYVILSAYDEYYFDKADVIIPLGIDAQCKLNKYKEYKDKFLTCSNYIYDMLDNKNEFYRFIKKNKILKYSDVKLIPTYDKYSKERNRYGKFIVKEYGGAGSSSNKIIEDWLHTIIDDYSDKCQIQDVLDIKYVYSINCLAYNGKLISSLNYIIKGFIKESFYNENRKVQVQHVPYKFKKVIKDILKKSHYNGILEIEFIVTKNDVAYLMECNPRVSSNMKCIDDNYNDNTIVPYTEYIFNPYIDIICNKSIKIPNLYHDKCDITFYGKVKCNKYTEHNGVIKLIK